MSYAQKRIALVTGCSGFIGFHLCQCLLSNGFEVHGIDSLNDYYDPNLKLKRQARLENQPHMHIVNDKIETPGLLMAMMEDSKPDAVIHLAAQAGVRYSIDNPRAYLEANLIGTFELLEAARTHPPAHMLMASTSSIYGANADMPYKESAKVDTQMSFYAATKKSNEAMAHSYSHLFDLPITMFRFFTVYGPWGRPDMALFKFTKAILNGDPIDVYNHGKMRRDFTYVTDLVEGIRLLIDAVPAPPAQGGPVCPNDNLSPVAPWRTVNIGNSTSVPLMEFIEAIEAATGQVAKKNMMPMQAGDVPATWADADLLRTLTGYAPQKSVKDGVAAFVEWYQTHYQTASS